ncbi:MAG: SBBP repeat-containing protein [Armatimonadetes bacterium]|nr:SBBP repeat-containing protein [Armatimonadota bacterium]
MLRISIPLLLRAFARPLALLACTTAATVVTASPAAPARRVATADVSLTFERNTGRWPSDVQFVARGGGGTLFLTRREAVLSLRKGGKASALRLKLQGSHGDAVASGLEKQPGIVNYFVGNNPANWRTKIPTYSRVKLAGVYPGVDLVYYGAGQSRTLEYDFVVKPGADPKQIRMAVSGAKSLRTVGGGLIASTACGDVTLNRPYAYQTIDGVRRQVACSFTVERNTVAFQVARYDAGRPLVVDPTLAYSTYLGGAGAEVSTGIAVDAAGCAYVTGTTGSTDYPTVAGSYAVAGSGDQDAFVTKLNAAGSALIYSTYLGGSNREDDPRIAVDAAGCAYVAGSTASSNFPVTAGAYQTAYSAADLFITKLNSAGTAPVYSTYLGGSGTDTASGIAVDTSGAVFVVGHTSGAFPTTAGAFDTTFDATQLDGFAAKLNASGAGLSYCTALGGSGEETIGDVAIDTAGCAYVVGKTTSANYPTTAGAYDTSYNGNTDGMITKVSADGTALVYSSYLGSTSPDLAEGVAVGADGVAVVSGYTASRSFPTTAGAYQTAFGGGKADAFLCRVAANGTSLLQSTYVGSTGNEAYTSVALADDGAVILATTVDGAFPVTGDAFQSSYAGAYDVALASLTPTLSALNYSTYLGGPGAEQEPRVAFRNGAAYVAGPTATGFPVTAGSFQTTASGTSDAFVLKVSFKTSVASVLTVNLASGAPGASLSLTAKLADGGGAGVSGKSVAYTLDATGIGSATTAATGIATLAYTITDTLSAGAHTLGGAFAGDAAYDASSGSNTLTITQATTGLSTVDRTGLVTTVVALKAYLKRTTDNAWLGGKSVAFTVAGTGVGSANTDASGQAVLNYTIATSAGAHAIGVSFAAETLYKASSAAATLTATTTNWSTARRRSRPTPSSSPTSSPRPTPSSRASPW